MTKDQGLKIVSVGRRPCSPNAGTANRCHQVTIIRAPLRPVKRHRDKRVTAFRQDSVVGHHLLGRAQDGDRVRYLQPMASETAAERDDAPVAGQRAALALVTASAKYRLSLLTVLPVLLVLLVLPAGRLAHLLLGLQAPDLPERPSPHCLPQTRSI